MRLILLLLFIPLSTLAQEESSMISCDCLKDAETQLDLNFCSKDCADASDSTMNELYERILNHYQQELNSMYVAKAPVDEERMEYVESMVETIKTSQEEFLSYRKSSMKIYSHMFEGGSIRPLVVNLCFFDITVQRIHTLTDLWDSIDN